MIGGAKVIVDSTSSRLLIYMCACVCVCVCMCVCVCVTVRAKTSLVHTSKFATSVLYNFGWERSILS